MLYSNALFLLIISPFVLSLFTKYKPVAPDPWFDEYYFGRNESAGFTSQQINNSRQGGFKSPIRNGQSIGSSNDFIAALNIKIDLPFKIQVLDGRFESFLAHITPRADNIRNKCD